MAWASCPAPRAAAEFVNHPGFRAHLLREGKGARQAEIDAGDAPGMSSSATSFFARECASPDAYAAVRNLVIGATRHAGFANIAHARRYARDDHRILALYGYT